MARRHPPQRHSRLIALSLVACLAVVAVACAVFAGRGGSQAQTTATAPVAVHTATPLTGAAGPTALAAGSATTTPLPPATVDAPPPAPGPLRDPSGVLHPTGGRHSPTPPDGTPLAAAAGSEPGSMSPVDLQPGWTSSVHHFESDGLARSYLLVRPEARSATPLPVIVMLHGRNLTPASMERIAGLWRTAGPSIQAYPAGYGRSWNAGGCCGEAYQAGINDVGFLTSVVHSVLGADPDADPGRVYAAGFSNGGRMAYRLACDDPGLFSAIVAVEAVPVDQCGSTKPLPVLIIANRFDPLLTIDAGQRPKVIYGEVEPTVDAEVERWRTLDGCDPGQLSAVDGRVTVTTYDHCEGTGRVTFAEYGYGGHDWSLGGPGTPSAAALTWGFLSGGVTGGQLTSVLAPPSAGSPTARTHPGLPTAPMPAAGAPT